MKHVRKLRSRSAGDRKTGKQLIITLLGIVALLFIFFYVGIPLLIKLSGFVSGLKKETVQTQNETVVLEPFLDTLPQATNSAKFNVSGNANEGENILLYLNGEKIAEKLVGKDGLFVFNNLTLNQGENEVYAVAQINNQESEPSKKQKIIYQNEPPKLEIEKPKDGDTFKREDREIEIRGTTGQGVTVSVNDRLVIVNPGGSFQTNYTLSDGENKLEIKATDTAGNTQKVELKVTYEP